MKTIPRNRISTLLPPPNFHKKGGKEDTGNFRPKPQLFPGNTRSP
jgi:hypothetical protein